MAPINNIEPPTGWTNEENAVQPAYYWAGNTDDIKDMMSKDYGLQNAVPIWRHDPKYGNLLFIFQASKGGATSYYTWNGIDSSVCRLVAQGIDEIRATINKFGEGKGYLADVRQEVVNPLS